MAVLYHGSVSIAILLTHLVSLFPTAQWLPSTGGIPGNPGVPEHLLDRMRGSSYRYGSSNGQYIPLPSTPISPHLYTSSPIYTSGGGNFQQNFQSPHQTDLTSLTGNGGNALTNGGLYGNPNGNGHGLAPGSVPSNSKSISGDYCFEPLVSCDTTNTLLYCIEGRCTCPNQWTLAPGNLPLNTVWHPELRRCVSTVGSGCHVLTSSQYPIMPPPPAARFGPSQFGSGEAGYNSRAESPSSSTKEIATTIIKGLIGLPSTAGQGGGMGYVFCQPGVQCVSHPGHQEVGICAGTINKINLFILFSVFSFPMLNYFFHYS